MLKYLPLLLNKIEEDRATGCLICQQSDRNCNLYFKAGNLIHAGISEEVQGDLALYELINWPMEKTGLLWKADLNSSIQSIDREEEIIWRETLQLGAVGQRFLHEASAEATAQVKLILGQAKTSQPAAEVNLGKTVAIFENSGSDDEIETSLSKKASFPLGQAAPEISGVVPGLQLGAYLKKLEQYGFSGYLYCQPIASHDISHDKVVIALKEGRLIYAGLFSVAQVEILNGVGVLEALNKVSFKVSAAKTTQIEIENWHHQLNNGQVQAIILNEEYLSEEDVKTIDRAFQAVTRLTTEFAAAPKIARHLAEVIKNGGKRYALLNSFSIKELQAGQIPASLLGVSASVIETTPKKEVLASFDYLFEEFLQHYCRPVGPEVFHAMAARSIAASDAQELIRMGLHLDFLDEYPPTINSAINEPVNVTFDDKLITEYQANPNSTAFDF